MKNGKCIMAFISLTIISAMIATSTAAQPRAPGVNIGDSFTYDNVSLHWFSNDPTATPPANFTSLNETQSFSVTVENIVGTNITFSLQFNFKNGTDKTETDWIDVDTGDSSNMTLIFIAGNLVPGDSIYSGINYLSLTINETVSRTYPNGNRDTNHLNMSMSMESPYANFSLATNLYWDKETGAVTELHMSMNSTVTYTTELTVSFEMIDSNKWVIPEFVGLPQTLLILASLTIIMLASKHKTRKVWNIRFA